MLSPLFDSKSLPLLEQMARFGERRQEVLAGNIANIDTPNYKMRDLPIEKFQQALSNAVQRRQQPNSLGATTHSSAADTAMLSELFPEHLFRATEAPANNVTFQDANNRGIENQMMEMTKNSMMQNFAVELMTAQLNLLQSVISERP